MKPGTLVKFKPDIGERSCSGFVVESFETFAWVRATGGSGPDYAVDYEDLEEITWNQETSSTLPAPSSE